MNLYLEELNSGYTGLIIESNTKAKEIASENNVSFLSTEMLAKQRIELGPYHQISWTGSRLTDSLIVNRDKFFIAKNALKSPLYDVFTSEYHEMGEEYLYEELDTSEIIAIPNESFAIPVEEFNDSELIRFLLGEQTEGYKYWLESVSIPALPFQLPPVSLTKHHKIPFIRPLVMRCTDNWSGLISVNDLHLPYGYRVYSNHAEGITVKNEETFTVEMLKEVKELLVLEDKSYTLRELQKHAFEFDKMGLLGVALRLIRHKSALPVSHATFTD